MYWKIDSKLPSNGCATKVAIRTETIINPTNLNKFRLSYIIILKIFINVHSKYCAYTVAHDASDETIAAIRAAKVKPSKPFGSKDIIVGYAWSDFSNIGNKIAAHIPAKQLLWALVILNTLQT